MSWQEGFLVHMGVSENMTPKAWFILTHRVLVSLGFLGLTFDCLTLISVEINVSETPQRDIH